MRASTTLHAAAVRTGSTYSGFSTLSSSTREAAGGNAHRASPPLQQGVSAAGWGEGHHDHPGRVEMKLIKSKKAIALLAMSIVAIVAAVGAYAYFTSTGTGSGTATVGTAANNLVTTGTPDAVALTPAGTGSVVSFKVANPSNFNQKISNIHLVSIAPDASHSTCATVLGTDFSMADVTVLVDGNIAPGATAQSISETGTLHMLDSGVSQDACKGAGLTLTFSTT
jgi:hypothetical protein